MIDQIRIQDLLFLDIETAPRWKSYSVMTEYEQTLWEEKKGKNREAGESPDEYYFNNAGIFAEFGKIICISAGYLQKDGLFDGFFGRSFYGDSEVKILKDFSLFISERFEQHPKTSFCGHNIREFDIPYICRRLVMNELPLDNSLLALQSKKPWESGLLDTMDLWKFGDFKNYISLKLLAYCLKVPSPKDDISGKDVGRVYWMEQGLDRIRIYCQKDVVTVAQVVLKMKGLSLLSESNVRYI
jgi:hypothetical protein